MNMTQGGNACMDVQVCDTKTNLIAAQKKKQFILFFYKKKLVIDMNTSKYDCRNADLASVAEPKPKKKPQWFQK